VEIWLTIGGLIEGKGIKQTWAYYD